MWVKKMKKELLESGIRIIVSLTENEMSLKDEDGIIHYKRMR